MQKIKGGTFWGDGVVIKTTGLQRYIRFGIRSLHADDREYSSRMSNLTALLAVCCSWQIEGGWRRQITQLAIISQFCRRTRTTRAVAGIARLSSVLKPVKDVYHYLNVAFVAHNVVTYLTKFFHGIGILHHVTAPSSGLLFRNNVVSGFLNLAFQFCHNRSMFKYSMTESSQWNFC